MPATRKVEISLLIIVVGLLVSHQALMSGQTANAFSYRLVFHNRYVRVFDAEIRPEQQAPIHDNANHLLWISLDTATVQFESRDGLARELHFDAGDARLFRTHEVASLRNKTGGTLHAAIVEMPRLGRGGCGCATDVESVVCGCSRQGRLPAFWALAIEGATLAETTLEPGQSLKESTVRDDTLLVAIRPLQLQHEVNLGRAWEWVASAPTKLELSAGGVEWLPEGKHHLTNTGESPARFITVEF